MRSATVRQLQIFSVAASHLSFARAAEKLHLTHAAISLQIKQLEDVCGTQLFDRIGKKVFLTEAGDILLDHARQILQSLKDADESLMALKGLKGGRVTIAVTSTAEYFAPGLLAEFRKAQADVRVRLLVDNREEVSRMLISNEVDLAIMGRPPADMEAEATTFAPHPFVIVAGADHPLVGRTALTLDDIAQETMIVREAGSGTRLAMEGFFREHSIEPNIDMEMGSNEAIKQAVVAGLGISFISQHTLGLELSAGRLVVLPVEGMPVMRRWFLVRHKSKRLTPALGAFWDFVLEFAPDYLKRLEHQAAGDK
ncbi:MAG: LysR family transcriptional regulator [Propionivibrio sp.]|jgi:DNA-binding transcriptional LysR family regulator|uniref:LysR family transcriptional regulator n=1 Tax=Propionivibrio sp. TaxID=2212460 RepID=UPI001B475011|nr:LysR family transcriptional regulator [Propionivibrio sp.]MBP7203423.1 LysR family transcriptional regulator [Propionivibrio sp.]